LRKPGTGILRMQYSQLLQPHSDGQMYGRWQ
jgi:hypothetical protein